MTRLFGQVYCWNITPLWLNPSNTGNGGVGSFYKNLPIKIRDDLSFNESIIVEIVIGRKKYSSQLFTKAPLNNFEKLYEITKKGNRFAVFFAGDSNGHSQLWWNDGDATAEGREIEQLTSLMGLSQPPNFEPNKNLSCIDLIFTDQPNCVIGLAVPCQSLSPSNNVSSHEFPYTVSSSF